MSWLDTIIQGILLGGLYALFAAGASGGLVPPAEERPGSEGQGGG